MTNIGIWKYPRPGYHIRKKMVFVDCAGMRCYTRCRCLGRCDTCLHGQCTSVTCDRRRIAHTDWAIYLEFSVAHFVCLWNLFWVIKNLPLEPNISWLFDVSRTEKKLGHEKETDKPILGWKSMVLIVLCTWFWSFD